MTGPLTVYRVVRSEHEGDPVLRDSLKSNYELSEPPRKVERSWTVVHMGISVWLDPESARGLARTWPKIGGYVAKLDLMPDLGINYGYTTRTMHHLTLWADPVKLEQAIVDIKAA